MQRDITWHNRPQEVISAGGNWESDMPPVEKISRRSIDMARVHYYKHKYAHICKYMSCGCHADWS